MLRRMAFEKALHSMTVEAEEMKEYHKAYEEFIDLLPMRLRCSANALADVPPVEIKSCILVGGMAEDLAVGLPCFDILLPFEVNSTQIVKEIKNGEAQVSVDVGALRNLQNFVDNKLLISSKWQELFTQIVQDACENLELSKYRLKVTTATPRGTILVEFQDKRSGSINLACDIEPVLQLMSEGSQKHLKANGNTWNLNISVRERDLVSIWDKNSNVPGCRRTCCRLLKAYVRCRCEELNSCGSAVAKSLMLMELKRTKNADKHWAADQLPLRFFDLLNLLIGSLKDGSLLSFHGIILNGEVNLLKFVTSEQKQALISRISGDIQKSDKILQIIDLQKMKI